MWTFYLEVIRSIPGLIIESVKEVEVWLMAIAFVLLFFNEKLGKRVAKWHLSRKLAIIPVAMYFVYLLLEGNYRRFEELQTAHDTTLKAITADLASINQEKHILTLLVDQKTKENAALAAGGRVLTDSQARIEAIRQQLLAHADKSPTKETFSAQAAKEWWTVAYAMKEQTVDFDSTLYLTPLDKDCTFEDFQSTVGSLRAIAMNITEDALTETVRPPDR